MRTYTRNFILTVSTLAILLLCPAVQASSITLAGNPYPNFGYDGILVGPYAATLKPDIRTEPDIKTWVFCLDLHIDTNVDTTYAGSLSHPTTEAEKEAAFLAAYSLYLGAPSGGVVNSVEGPISMAIWEIMSTLGTTSADPAAAPFIQLAQYASLSGRISEHFLNNVQIWTPDKGVTSQRFMTAFRDDDMVENAIPEPGTLLFLGSGILLMAVSRIRRRR